MEIKWLHDSTYEVTFTEQEEQALAEKGDETHYAVCELLEIYIEDGIARD